MTADHEPEHKTVLDLREGFGTGAAEDLAQLSVAGLYAEMDAKKMASLREQIEDLMRRRDCLEVELAQRRAAADEAAAEAVHARELADWALGELELARSQGESLVRDARAAADVYRDQALSRTAEITGAARKEAESFKYLASEFANAVVASAAAHLPEAQASPRRRRNANPTLAGAFIRLESVTRQRDSATAARILDRVLDNDPSGDAEWLLKQVSAAGMRIAARSMAGVDYSLERFHTFAQERERALADEAERARGPLVVAVTSATGQQSGAWGQRELVTASSTSALSVSGGHGEPPGSTRVLPSRPDQATPLAIDRWAEESSPADDDLLVWSPNGFTPAPAGAAGSSREMLVAVDEGPAMGHVYAQLVDLCRGSGVELALLWEHQGEDNQGSGVVVMLRTTPEPASASGEDPGRAPAADTAARASSLADSHRIWIDTGSLAALPRTSPMSQSAQPSDPLTVAAPRVEAVDRGGRGHDAVTARGSGVRGGRPVRGARQFVGDFWRRRVIGCFVAVALVGTRGATLVLTFAALLLTGVSIQLMNLADRPSGNEPASASRIDHGSPPAPTDSTRRSQPTDADNNCLAI